MGKELLKNKNRAAATEVNMPIAVYQGRFSINGQGLQTALEGEKKPAGAGSKCWGKVCYSMSEVKEKLQIDQSFNIGVGPVFGLTQKMKFLESLKVTKTSRVIVVYAHSSSKSGSVSANFIEQFQPPEDPGKVKQFCKAFGDSYAKTITYGAEYLGAYVFSAVSSEQLSTLDAEIKASGIIKVVSLGAEFKTSLEKLTKNENLTYEFYHEIRGHENMRLPLEHEIVEFAHKFPEIKPTNPIVVSVEYLGYENVYGCPPIFNKVAQNRGYFDGEFAPAGSGLTSKLEKINIQLNGLNRIQDVHNFFNKLTVKPKFTDAGWEEAYYQASIDQEAILSQVRMYASDPLADFKEPELPSLLQGLAQLKHEHQILGPEGPLGFCDVKVDQFINQKNKISSIAIWYSYIDSHHTNYIYGIETKYKSATNDGRELICARGSLTGDCVRYDFDADENISGIECYDSGHMRGLMIHTNKNGSQPYVAGTFEGNHNKFDVPEGSFFLGFAGLNDQHPGASAPFLYLKLVVGKFLPTSIKSILE